MSQIVVDATRQALGPLFATGVVQDVQLGGLATGGDRLRPLIRLKLASDSPISAVAEISRLIFLAGVDVDWALELDEIAA